MSTFDSSAVRVIDVGTYRIKFTGDNATFDYVIDGRSGSMPLTRQAF
jgi:hypothetical protein